jgi:hypothetical protein
MNGKAARSRDCLASPQLDLAREALNDQYISDFPGLTDETPERDVDGY